MEQVETSFKSKEPKIISLIQNKGGSFRTSLAFAIAKNFIRNNRIVRCYDWDQQQNLQKMLQEIKEITGKSSKTVRDAFYKIKQRGFFLEVHSSIYF